ncbi:hydrolase, NUDIX family [Gleimia coleocanis DSM 15436]|uniref:8-oxo-dGTP diphosphatase n=1 Tax=Gleimia coleocanis DSM 15436 TaxID=525245 RepID=C0VYQ2_9ACTO|nr:NUDIX domain-containing protein [Gleimia coleocanis]EEH64555.1 hydrolase, NUDIX family [Gleimia coleocanis DSM 15436]
MTPLLAPVVAAAIFNPHAKDPQILCAQRAYPDNLRGKWELPGGKVEPGEEYTTAIMREIREELRTEITLHSPILNPGSSDGSWPILNGRVMHVWLATCTTAPTHHDDHLAIRWCSFTEASHLDWLSPNIPIMKAAFQVLTEAKRTNSLRPLGNL